MRLALECAESLEGMWNATSTRRVSQENQDMTNNRRHWTVVLAIGSVIALAGVFAGGGRAEVTEVDPEEGDAHVATTSDTEQEAAERAATEQQAAEQQAPRSVESVTTFGREAPDPTDEAGDFGALPDNAEAEAEAVMQRLMRQRQQMPAIAPSVSGAGRNPDAGGQLPDPAVIGVAPNQPAPQLRREGEFIVSRRGRVFVLSDGRTQFRFEADAERSPEPPVFLMPCQLLEHIEQLERQRGDELVFVLSGQVFTYHGGNWLLPTMMKIEIDRNNLGR